MSKLYTEYADLYHKMYQSFIDYDEEYQFYKELLDRHKARSILEIGCGTGQLARRFLADGYTYTGIDISNSMLEYARKGLPAFHFHQMDMRDINLPLTFDGVIITARSISYTLTNKDVMDTFQSIKKVLQNGGILIFDLFAFFSDYQLILPVKELSYGEVSSLIDLNYSYPLLVLAFDVRSSTLGIPHPHPMPTIND